MPDYPTPLHRIAATRTMPWKDHETLYRAGNALLKIASGSYSDFAGDPGEWATTIAKEALGDAENEPF